ncbi:hypothetical protein N7541_002997 [Penicillium brevicompactum]|uniref:Uncharacterized protein n=1 Tax=Penicillium brevicompactum TaxID=5074 RepID=A0A9W9UYE9_PENBR|nr:hypothetical protein N7452_001153 [Penicillium brevicompactum]KAJ5362153.1 hypothetical protein N7541_002997 [Penicillium brevicompactum]
MNLDINEIRRPLSVFAKQSESQRYIKNIRNLGDAWRRLSDEPASECDEDSIFIETTFGLSLKITPTGAEISVAPITVSTEQGPLVSTDTDFLTNEDFLSAAMTGRELPVSVQGTRKQELTEEPPSSTKAKNSKRPKQYRIFPDFGTDFLWRESDDICRDDSDDDYCLDSEDLLKSPSFPPSLLELYDAWVKTYNGNFDRRLNKPGNFQASVFATVSESVAWNVAGYLLAWRITMAPEVDRIELSAGTKNSLLKKGKGREEDTKITKEFFEDMCNILKKGLVE